MNWPKLDEISTEELATKVVKFSEEIARRWMESKERILKAAVTIWPELKKALALAGKEIDNFHKEPIMPEWAEEPVISTKGIYKKPRNKKEAMVFALTYGDGHWATIGELYLWLGGGGPIVDRAMTRFGFGPKKQK